MTALDWPTAAALVTVVGVLGGVFVKVFGNRRLDELDKRVSLTENEQKNTSEKVESVRRTMERHREEQRAERAQDREEQRETTRALFEELRGLREAVNQRNGRSR